MPYQREEKNHRHYEDRALKTAIQVFGSELLPYLGVGGELKTLLPTESVILDMKTFHSDFNFIRQDDSIVHLEFQSSSWSIQDLRVNRVRESLLSLQYHTPVVSYVICSGKIKHPRTEITEGLNTYRVKAIVLNQMDADELLESLHHTLDSRQELKREDLVKLLLTPLMGGNTSQYERITDSFHILQQSRSILEKYETEKYQSVLYALASKFLSNSELNQFKEDIKMTYLGELLYNDGWQDGIEKNKKDTILNMLDKEFAPSLIADIMNVSITYVNQIAKEQFPG